MKALNINSFPLNGMRLIEASAGTGKTYTIAALYLRLLLEDKLKADQILVVTFTEAATAELKGRIRERIRAAIDFIVGKNESDNLEGLLLNYRNDKSAIQHLNDVLINMDESAIYTIHGFCQRMLVENAFESGAIFEATFLTDENKLRTELTRDYWRSELVGKDDVEITQLRKLWKTPEALSLAISPLLNNSQAIKLPDISQQEILKKERKSLIKNLSLQWIESKGDIVKMFTEDKSLSRRATTWKVDHYTKAISLLDDYLQQEVPAVVLPDKFELFTASMLSEPKNLIGKKQPLAHDFFDLAEAVLQCENKLKSLYKASVLLSTSEYVINALAEYKEKSGVLFFDDLLKQLEKSLSSENKIALIKNLRKRYPVAMIDEFQDTDPVQYQIFNTIYGDNLKDISTAQALFMIGDPKQAIYSFRGADIFTYMQARNDTDVNHDHFTLDKNWRSQSDYVAAVNHLFDHAERPFIYDKDIGFYPAKAAALADESPLLIKGEAVSPFVAWMVSINEENNYQGTISKKWAFKNIATGCANEITLLLDKTSNSVIGKKSLQASDIAILVRDRYEAAAIRQALTKKSIASVFISRDSIFESTDARDLTHLLQAVIEPEKPVLLRTALATSLIGWDANKIDAMNNNEMVWEQCLYRFQSYRKLWTEDGFIVMFMHLLLAESVYNTVLSSIDGERQMTNLLQLAEVLQKAEKIMSGKEALLAWLIDQRNNPDVDAEEQQLRLESDDNLVKVVTIHKSKGMEYPIVFLPFIWTCKIAKAKDVFNFHDVNSHKLYADLGANNRKENLKLADTERLAEDVRLLYVALTRAKYRCYFSWGQFSGASKSAMAWLLHQNNMVGMSDEALQQVLEKINIEKQSLIEITGLPENNLIGDEEIKSSIKNAGECALKFNRKLKRRYFISSFSALSASSKTLHKNNYNDVELPDYDKTILSESTLSTIDQTQLDQFNFPKGATAGECLHGIFEEIDFEEDKSRLVSVVKHKLNQYGFDEKWNPVVVEWVNNILQASLNRQTGLSLDKVSFNKRLVEMAFHFPLNNLSAIGLNKIRGNEILSFSTINGLMKGFIDLVFEFQGKYFILDYKSNYLGDQFNNYTLDTMQDAMSEHQYDLQYQIYTVALHRYLKMRITNYSYEEHFGGVYYLFLRGIRRTADENSGIYFIKPDYQLIDSFDRLFTNG